MSSFFYVAFIRRLHLLFLSFYKRLFNYSNLVSLKFPLIGSLIVEMALLEIEVEVVRQVGDTETCKEYKTKKLLI